MEQDKKKSHKNLTFKRDSRLLTAKDYNNVFSDAQRFGNRSFTLLARENGLGYARLGLAISKKNAKRAIDRNRIKRYFRESFRLNQHNLPCVDIVAMSKKDAPLLDDNEMLKQIDSQWYFMKKKFAKRSLK